MNHQVLIPSEDSVYHRFVTDKAVYLAEMNAIVTSVLEQLEAGEEPEGWQRQLYATGIGSVGYYWLLGRALGAKGASDFGIRGKGKGMYCTISSWPGMEGALVEYEWAVNPKPLRVSIDLDTYEKYSNLDFWAWMRTADTSQTRTKMDIIATAGRIAFARGERVAAAKCIKGWASVVTSAPMWV